MEAQELHRGRLIDHIQLIVRDLSAAQRFYTAIFKSLEIPIGGTAKDYFWADELFISSPESEAAQGPSLVGIISLFRHRTEVWWTPFTKRL